MRFEWLITIAIGTAVVAGCGTADRTGSGSEGVLRVVTTTSMLADLVRQIAGEQATVRGLMGPGVDPHLYQASAGDVTRMSQADILFYNGLHLEGKMADVFHQMRRRDVPTVAVAEESVDASELIESDAFQGNYDPHIWFDVALWIRAGETVMRTLAEQDPEHRSEYEANFQSYRDELLELDQYIKNRVQDLPPERRILITSHDAFGYFGRAYGFEVRGLQGISTATEAGTADVQSLVNFVVENRIPAMFIESSVSPKGIEAVREAVRSRGFDVAIGGTLYGDALGDPRTEAGTYTGMVRHNVDTIVTSLQSDHLADGRSMADVDLTIDHML